jgi:hypothetical protein
VKRELCSAQIGSSDSSLAQEMFAGRVEQHKDKTRQLALFSSSLQICSKRQNTEACSFHPFRRTLVTLHLAEGVAEDVAVSQKSKKEEERMREDKRRTERRNSPSKQQSGKCRNGLMKS